MTSRLIAILGLLMGASLLVAANPVHALFNDTTCLLDQQCDDSTDDLKCPNTTCSGGAPNCKPKTTTGGGFDFKWCKCSAIPGPPQSSDECHAMLKRPVANPPAAYECACSPSDCETGSGDPECDWESGSQAYKKCVCPN